MNKLWLRDCKEPKGIALVGNTFPVRVQLRAMGCRWTGLEWRAPEEVWAKAQALVDDGPQRKCDREAKQLAVAASKGLL